MGCNCKKQSEDAKKYAKIKQLAEKYAKTMQQTVVIYRIDGGFSFAEASSGIGGIEYLYPL